MKPEALPESSTTPTISPEAMMSSKRITSDSSSAIACAAQRVDAGAGRIDGQPADAFDIELEAPVLGLGHDRLCHGEAPVYSAAVACASGARSPGKRIEREIVDLDDLFRRLVGGAHDRGLVGGQDVGRNRVGDGVAVVAAGDDALLHGLDEPGLDLLGARDLDQRILEHGR